MYHSENEPIEEVIKKAKQQLSQGKIDNAIWQKLVSLAAVGEPELQAELLEILLFKTMVKQAGWQIPKDSKKINFEGEKHFSALEQLSQTEKVEYAFALARISFFDATAPLPVYNKEDEIVVLAEIESRKVALKEVFKVIEYVFLQHLDWFFHQLLLEPVCHNDEVTAKESELLVIPARQEIQKIYFPDLPPIMSDDLVFLPKSEFVSRKYSKAINSFSSEYRRNILSINTLYYFLYIFAVDDASKAALQSVFNKAIEYVEVVEKGQGSAWLAHTLSDKIPLAFGSIIEKPFKFLAPVLLESKKESKANNGNLYNLFFELFEGNERSVAVLNLHHSDVVDGQFLTYDWCDFSEKKFISLEMNYKNLRGVSFKDAKLVTANLKSCNLQGADFSTSTETETWYKLDGANCCGANFFNRYMYPIPVSEEVSIGATIFVDSETILPDGTRPKAAQSESAFIHISEFYSPSVKNNLVRNIKRFLYGIYINSPV